MDSQKQTTTIWIVKYCLSEGIRKCEAILRGSGVATYEEKPQDWLTKGDYYFSETEARDEAVRRRDKKVQSLRKQLEKLEKLIF